MLLLILVNTFGKLTCLLPSGNSTLYCPRVVLPSLFSTWLKEFPVSESSTPQSKLYGIPIIMFFLGASGLEFREN